MLARSLKEQRWQQQQAATSTAPTASLTPVSRTAAAPPDALADGRAALAQATRGAVFFATPHFGSQFAAMGWRLRHVPYASPAPVLGKLTPGPHLEELNDVMKKLYDKGQLRVTAAGEGKPTTLSPVLPKILVVPPVGAGLIVFHMCGRDGHCTAIGRMAWNGIGVGVIVHGALMWCSGWCCELVHQLLGSSTGYMRAVLRLSH